MLFNSYPFIFVFLPVVLLGISRRPHWPAAPVIWLALASLVFYSFSNWPFVALLLASIAFNYLVGWPSDLEAVFAPVHALPCSRRASPATCWRSASSNMPGFWSPISTRYSRRPSQSNILLPVGISFYTFTQIAFLVDAYRGKVTHYALPHYALFVTYFPHLIAGPILHHRDMIPQFESAEFKASESASDFVWPDHFRNRPVQENCSRRRHPAIGRTRFQSGLAVVRSGLDRRAGLYFSALFRFFRLFRHGDRNLADVRHLPAVEFQFALPGDEHHRLLAPLAHDAVAVPARLSLHPARGKPVRLVAALCEPDDHDAARRPLARRRLDLCCLGRVARALPLRQSRLDQLWSADP